MKNLNFKISIFISVCLLIVFGITIISSAQATTIDANVTTDNLYLGSQGAIYQNDLQVFNASSTNYSLSVGTEAGKNLSDAGINSVFVGYQAGYNATSSYSNIGVGYKTLHSLANNGGWDVGAFNIAIGEEALYNVSGWNNIGVGYHALNALTTGSNNIAVGGIRPLSSLTTGGYNIAIGDEVLEHNISGEGNAVIGYLSFSNNTNSYNTGLGHQTGAYSTTGTKNTAIGSDALGWFSEGSWNTAVGADALGRNDGKSFANTALGYQAGRAGSAGYANASSTWIGYQSGVNIRTGSKNIALGYKTADTLTTGSNNIVIGYDIDTPSATSDNTLTIGNIIFANGLGNTGTTIATGTVGIGIATPTAKFQVSRSTGGTEKLFQVGTTTATDLFSVNSNGTVGIGTSTPWQDMELAVTGDILLTGTLYKSGTAYTNPDYVFAKYFGNPRNEYIPTDYTMLSLDELKAYVQEHHHLPGVELKDNKVDLFESNRLNLEKIEELSLYILQMKEEINELKNEVQILKNK